MTPTPPPTNATFKMLLPFLHLWIIGLRGLLSNLDQMVYYLNYRLFCKFLLFLHHNYHVSLVHQWSVGNKYILIHYCTAVFQYWMIPVVQYHPVLKNSSAIMALFLFHNLFDGVLESENPDFNVFLCFFFSLVDMLNTLKTELRPLTA